MDCAGSVPATNDRNVNPCTSSGQEVHKGFDLEERNDFFSDDFAGIPIMSVLITGVLLFLTPTASYLVEGEG